MLARPDSAVAVVPGESGKGHKQDMAEAVPAPPRAFVSYISAAAATSALDSDGDELLGRAIRVTKVDREVVGGADGSRRGCNAGSNLLMVSGLPDDVTDDDLLGMFDEAEVAELARDKRTGQAKGFGYVLFRTADAAAGGVAAHHGRSTPALGGGKLRVAFSSSWRQLQRMTVSANRSGGCSNTTAPPSETNTDAKSREVTKSLKAGNGPASRAGHAEDAVLSVKSKRKGARGAEMGWRHKSTIPNHQQFTGMKPVLKKLKSDSLEREKKQAEKTATASMVAAQHMQAPRDGGQALGRGRGRGGSEQGNSSGRGRGRDRGRGGRGGAHGRRGDGRRRYSETF